MKLFYENENGEHIELSEIQSIGEGDIVIKLNCVMSKVDIENIEHELSKKFDRNVIILDAKFSDVLIVPPKK